MNQGIEKKRLPSQKSVPGDVKRTRFDNSRDERRNSDEKDNVPTVTTEITTVLPSLLQFLCKIGYLRTAKALRKEGGMQEADPTAKLEGNECVDLVAAIQRYKRREQKKRGKTTATPADRCQTAPLGSEHPAAIRITRKNPTLRVDTAESRPLGRLEQDKIIQKVKDKRLLNKAFSNSTEFGQRAAAELGIVRGKDFRKEMQKKKRASWKGQGAIDSTAVNSFQFASSDSDS